MALRFGLCCLFKDEPVSFKATTAKALMPLSRAGQLGKVSGICLHNTENLLLAVKTAHRLGIGAFRIMSPLFPRMTHPEVGYTLDELPDAGVIRQHLQTIRTFARDNDIRLSFHPDQFVVLSSPHQAVIANSVQELEYQGQLAEAVGADVINIHAGGVYGDKLLALERFCHSFQTLSEAVKSRLTLENDDVSYTVRDLLPICQRLSIPLVFDLHHHRCNPDGLTVEEATDLAAATWEVSGKEPYCHLSSPKGGWGEKNVKPHADYIDPADLPACWRDRTMTVDIEAKDKELAVLRIMGVVVSK
jgi:UV DNA damage endonuclease